MPRLSVTLLADPGVPTRQAQRAFARLDDMLLEATGLIPEIELRSETLMLDAESRIDTSIAAPLLDASRRAHEESADEDSHVVLLFTEVPRYRHGRIVLAETLPAEGLAIVSSPALGAIGVRHVLPRVLVECVSRLLDPVQSDAVSRAPGVGRWRSRFDHSSASVSRSRWGRGPQIIAGMTRSNEPFRTAPRLSTAFAAAAAAAAFGIFYQAIWLMALALSPERLLAIAALGVLAMTAWLMFSNGLWDRPDAARRKTLTLYYNCSTALTLLMCMLMLYTVLFTMILIGASIIIDPGFMSGVIDRQATMNDYLRIAWLSAAMGTVAGGLGSSFDSSTDIRRLTHGQRERLRRREEAA